MIMKDFIPKLDDVPDSDDSSDNMPYPGLIGVGPESSDIDVLDDEEDDDEDLTTDEEADAIGDPPPQDEGSNNDVNDSDGEVNMGYEDSDSDLSDDSSVAEATLQEIFDVPVSIESQRDIPPAIKADCAISDICFHPSLEILATSTMDGEVILYRYSENSTEEQTRYSHHCTSCRAICFSEDGSTLFTISKDKSLAIIDTQNSAIKCHIKDAHEAGLFSFCAIDDHLCATGDDDGVVKIWDFRRKHSIFDFKTGEQTVTSLIADEKKKMLGSAVSDGSIAGFNIRGRKLIVQSEMYESEFTSLCLIKNDRKLLVGSGDGSMVIFNWGEFGHHIDRFSGHPDEIHCIAALTDKLVLTGCEDGIIRATHLYPHRFVGIVGQHKGSGVDNISTSCDGRLLASCGMDETVNFWNIDYLYDVEVNERKKGRKKADIEKNLPSSRRRDHKEFFNDFPSMVESDDENGPVAGPSHTTD